MKHLALLIGFAFVFDSSALAKQYDNDLKDDYKLTDHIEKGWFKKAGAGNEPKNQSTARSKRSSGPIISGINYTWNGRASFETEVCQGAELCFSICTRDTKPKNGTVLSWNSGITDAVFQIVNMGAKNEIARFCWTPNAEQVKVDSIFSFKVTATPQLGIHQ